MGVQMTKLKDMETPEIKMQNEKRQIDFTSNQKKEHYMTKLHPISSLLINNDNYN